MQGVEIAWPEGVGVRREEDVGRRSLVDGIRFKVQGDAGLSEGCGLPESMTMMSGRCRLAVFLAPCGAPCQDQPPAEWMGLRWDQPLMTNKCKQVNGQVCCQNQV